MDSRGLRIVAKATTERPTQAHRHRDTESSDGGRGVKAVQISVGRVLYLWFVAVKVIGRQSRMKRRMKRKTHPLWISKRSVIGAENLESVEEDEDEEG